MCIDAAMVPVQENAMLIFAHGGQQKIGEFLFQRLGVGLLRTDILWLADAKWSLIACCIADIWLTTPFMMLMILAGLQGLDSCMLEAAKIDGANLLQQIWYVELPAIKDIIVIQFILQAGNIMSIGFEKAYALQTDMNLPASEILSTYVYRIGLLNGDYGYSTAVGLFNSVINVILLIFVNWVVKKLNDGEGL